MNWIISFRCGSSSDAKKASCGFQQLVGVAKLLILTAQLGYLCNEVYGQGLSNPAFAASGLCPLPGCVCHDTPNFGATAWHAAYIERFSARMRSSTRRTTRSFASWSNFFGIFQIFPSTQTEQNLGHFREIPSPHRWTSGLALSDDLQCQTDHKNVEPLSR